MRGDSRHCHAASKCPLGRRSIIAFKGCRQPACRPVPGCLPQLSAVRTYSGEATGRAEPGEAFHLALDTNLGLTAPRRGLLLRLGPDQQANHDADQFMETIETGGSSHIPSPRAALAAEKEKRTVAVDLHGDSVSAALPRLARGLGKQQAP